VIDVTSGVKNGIWTAAIAAAAVGGFLLGAAHAKANASLAWWKDAADVASTLADVALLLGGIWVVHKWLTERSDRTADVLIGLDRTFNEHGGREGRETIDDDEKYGRISTTLADNVRTAGQQRVTRKSSAVLTSVDAALRFYLLLNALVKSGQVDLEAAGTCFRYYLCHYHNRKRPDLKAYVDTFYPTLKQWIEEGTFVTDRHVAMFRPAWGEGA
jgi:hypothetical protein